jgi:hypothetical protein
MSSCTLKTVGLAIASPTQAHRIDIFLRIIASGSSTGNRTPKMALISELRLTVPNGKHVIQVFPVHHAILLQGLSCLKYIMW